VQFLVGHGNVEQIGVVIAREVEDAVEDGAKGVTLRPLLRALKRVISPVLLGTYLPVERRPSLNQNQLLIYFFLSFKLLQ